jgi:uncharacterized protein YyaL (SSP411 family)
MSDPAANRPNRLIQETSPYLLQHAHNPVDWYPWGEEALSRARREDRPIFLSIGYSACHWCHVMERECFEDPRIAALMNERLVSIKVDREERPDLDDVYMAAVQAMTGSGGWPMSVFLTPELEPFFAGTYFPPEDRHGIPAFPRVVEAVSDAYRERRAEVTAQARQVAAHLAQQLEVPPGRAEPQRLQLEGAVRRLAAAFDARHGGFGGAPKFPAPMTLEFLLRSWHRSRDPETLRMVTLTLDRMAAGGIHDQLGGGFARYSTDAIWLVPHFEKMLYDNALLAHCYLEAHRATGQAAYAEVASRTLDFMIDELQTEDGGFASALDADSEGREGAYYAWTRQELLAALAAAGLGPDEAERFASYWDVTDEGSWEGSTVLHVAGEAPEAHALERARAALLAARALRPRPARDEKQLASWNGLAIRALAAAALLEGGERFGVAARRAIEFVRGRLLRDGDRLWRTSRGGRSHTPAFCSDYADVADGLLAAHAAQGEADDLLLARALVERAIADFWDDASGTFFDAGAEHETTIARPRSLLDSATPSANSVMADLLQRLALLTGDEDLDRRARAVLRAVAPALERQPSAFGRMLAAADRALDAPIDAVVALPRSGDPAGAALRKAVAAPYAPNLVIGSVEPGSGLATWPLFAEKVARGGAATAYVCRGYACEEPTSDPELARRQVEGLAAPR